MQRSVCLSSHDGFVKSVKRTGYIPFMRGRSRNTCSSAMPLTWDRRQRARLCPCIRDNDFLPNRRGTCKACNSRLPFAPLESPWPDLDIARI